MCAVVVADEMSVFFVKACEVVAVVFSLVDGQRNKVVPWIAICVLVEHFPGPT